MHAELDLYHPIHISIESDPIDFKCYVLYVGTILMTTLDIKKKRYVHNNLGKSASLIYLIKSFLIHRSLFGNGITMSCLCEAVSIPKISRAFHEPSTAFAYIRLSH